MPVSESIPRASIFLGPTLPTERARTILDADYLPPIKRGDIDALLSDPPDVIGIVDGQFFQNFSISPMEVLRALDRGITVFGAASMGALRAVELSAFGMIGIGEVFRLYRSGRIDADDEVAVAYSAHDQRPTSEALVNIRYALATAVERGLLRPPERRSLLRALKKTYFPERNYDLVLHLAASMVERDRYERLRSFLSDDPPSVKAQDALLLLEHVRHELRRRDLALPAGSSRALSGG